MAGVLWAVYEGWLWRVRSLLSRGVPVGGEIIAREDAGAYAHLTVRYDDARGEAHTLRAALWRDRCDALNLSPGAALTLLCDPSNLARPPAPYLPLREQWRFGAAINWPVPPPPDEPL